LSEAAFDGKMAFHIDGQWMWDALDNKKYDKPELLRSMLIAFAHGTPGKGVRFESQNDPSALRIQFPHKGQMYMAHCQVGGEEITRIEIQRVGDRSSDLLKLDKKSGARDDGASVSQKRGASPNRLQAQWIREKRSKSGPPSSPPSSNEMDAQPLESMSEQPPSPGEPAQAAAPAIGESVSRTATYDRKKTDRLWDAGKNIRQPELKHYGYRKATDIEAVSQACDTVGGEYRGDGLYIHRNVRLKDGQTATVLRCLDEANNFQLLDLRIVVPAGAYCNTEDSVLKKMQESINRRNGTRAGLADKTEEPPRYRFASRKQMSGYWREHQEEFQGLGFRDGAPTLNRLLRLCEAVEPVRVWEEDGMKLVRIGTPNGQSAELLWRVKDNTTTVLRVVPPDQDAETFRQHVLKWDDRGMQTQAGKMVKRLQEQGVMTKIDSNAIRRIFDRHGTQLAGIIGKTANRDVVSEISLLCDNLIRNDPDRCTDRGNGVTEFKIPRQASGLSEEAHEAHVLRWVYKGKVIELLPCSADKVEVSLDALRSFMDDSKTKREAIAKAKAARLGSQVSGAGDQAV
jgi:hypothetical protein